MPKIPVRDYSQSGGQAATLQPQQIQPMPGEAAFSTDPGRAVERYGQVVQQLGDQLGRIAAQERKNQVDKAALQIDTSNRQKLDSILSDPNNGLLTRQLDNAQGITTQFDLAAAAAHKDSIAGIDDPDVKELAGKMFRNTVEAYKSRVIQHQAQQTQEAYKVANQSAIEKMVYDASVIRDPGELISSINTAIGVNKNYLKSIGTPADQIDIANNSIAEKAITSNLTARLQTDPAGAKSSLDVIRGQIDPAVSEHIDKSIEDKFNSLAGDEIFNKVGNQFRRTDGSYDVEAVRALIDKQPNLSQDAKDKRFTVVKGRMNEASSNFQKMQASNELDFMNAANSMKNQGMSIDQVKQAILPKYAVYGDADKAKKEDDINKLYDPKHIDDDQIYTELSWGIRNNTLTMDDIKSNKNILNGNHYESLKAVYLNNVLHPKTGFAGYQEEINLIMQKNGILGKTRQGRFQSALEDKFQSRGGGTGTDLIALAQEEAGKVVTNKWISNSTLGLFGETRQYLIDTPIPGSKEDIAKKKALSEYQAIIPVPGSKEAKARERLRKTNRAITPETVNHVISMHTDWE
jgi:hypothetical protein